MRKELSKNNIDTINRFRQSQGLKPILKKEVKCLSCQKTFESQDYPRQRMCDYCRVETDESYTIGQDLGKY